MPVSKVRSLFFPRINVCMAIGGKGDSDGFSKGAATNASRALFAKNVAATVDRLGYDCVGKSLRPPNAQGPLPNRRR